MKEINFSFLSKWIKKANEEDGGLLIGEMILREEFGKLDFTPKKCFFLMTFLDYLWSTSLRKHIYKGKGDLQEIAMRLSKAIPGIEEKLKHLQDMDLIKLDLSEENKDYIILEKCVMEAKDCNNSGGISFPCKFLHFLEPKIFVPMDTKVPIALDDFKIKIISSVEGYLKLLQTYKLIESKLTHEQKQRLIKEDYEQICNNLKVFYDLKNIKESNIFRIIDKALWIYGKHLEDYKTISRLKKQLINGKKSEKDKKKIEIKIKNLEKKYKDFRKNI